MTRMSFGGTGHFIYKVWVFPSSGAARGADRAITDLRSQLNAGSYYFFRGTLDHNTYIFALKGCTCISQQTMERVRKCVIRNGGRELEAGSDRDRDYCVKMLDRKMDEFAAKNPPYHVHEQWHEH